MLAYAAKSSVPMPMSETIEPQADTSDTQAADHWSRALRTETPAEFGRDVFWQSIPEVNRYYTVGACGGDERFPSWIDYCLDFLRGRLPVERMLSVGCGAGSLERFLAMRGAFRQCDAWDIASGAVETARRLALREGYTHIAYDVRDANTYVPPPEFYDAVWFNSSLHHVAELETVLAGISRSLKPGGFLFLNEYVGASVFDFPPRQREAMFAALDLIPKRFRRRFPDGAVVEQLALPTPAEVAAVDPSESVRSAEILGVVGDAFEVLACNPAGGTLLQFLLNGIAGNFQPEDPESMKVLDMILKIERTLIEVGDLPSDFVLVVARRREPPPPPRPRVRTVRPPAAPEPEPARSAEEVRLRAEIESLRAKLRQVESTRFWRAAHLYYAGRRRLRRWLGLA